MNELNKNLLNVAELSKFHYKKISKQTGVEMHGEQGITQRIEVIRESVAKFQSNSRELASSAQSREYQTIQPKENVIESKATITIKNYLGGYYYFTVDEALLYHDNLFLIEKKHSEKSLVPNISDIKDGLVKMMLFSNLSDIIVLGKPRSAFPTLGLTSMNVKGYCHSLSTEREQNSFFSINGFSRNATQILLDLFHEGQSNNILIFLMDSRAPKLQNNIVDEFLERQR